MSDCWRRWSVFVFLAASGVARGGGIEPLATPAGGWPVSLPGRAVRQIVLNEDWSGASALSFTVRAEPAPAEPLRLLVSLIAGDGWWYQSSALIPFSGTKPRTVRLDIGHLSSDWTPCGHLRPWDGYARQRVGAVSVSVFSMVPYEGVLHVASPSLESESVSNPIRLFLYDTEVLTEQPRAGAAALVEFRLSRSYVNPFERGLVSVALEKDGVEVASAPAFFYQGYRPMGQGTLKPVGAAAWRARLIPPTAGRFRWVVRAKDGDGVVELAAGELAAEGAHDPVAGTGGLLAHEEAMPFRLARKVADKEMVFRLSGGKWEPDCEESAEPVAHAWRVPLEWTERWGRYGGLGRYNMEAAWEFDRLLSQAEATGVRLPLALNADEPFQGQGKYNWFTNPLAAHMGGPIEAPSGYFTDETAQKFFEQQVSYIAARWGSSPAVSRFELWMSVPANHAETWHDRVGAFLAREPLAGKPVVSRHPQGAEVGKRRNLTGFDRLWSSWQAASAVSPSTRVEYVADRISDGVMALRALAEFPGEAAIFSEVTESWHGYGRLAFDVYIPKDAPGDMRAMVYVRERDWWWYETLLEPLLRPGDWTKLIVDISPDSPVWKPVGHKRLWDGYVAAEIREMGIRIFGHRKYEGPVYIDKIELWPDPEHPQPIRVTSLAANGAKVGQYEKFELSFQLSRVFENPFDPREADVRGHFVSPSGKHIDVPAFFYQGYERELVERVERLTAAGGSGWKVRFATGEMGVWQASIKVNGAAVAGGGPVRFEVTRSDLPGYVRQSRKDPAYFEFTSGQFFYPIGHALRSPSDGRRPYNYPFALPDNMGTYIYDEYFRKMAAAGENMTRIWMCSWWCGLEWNKRWRGFGGIGRYNMENAWRLDHLVEQAAKNGIYIALDTTNHGQYSTGIDHEWENNPYNVANGGFLQSASDFFTDGKARQKYKDRMRYTIARWGYSPNIMMWTLFSEVEFVEEYWKYNHNNPGNFSPHVAPWHEDIARFVKATDPFGHLVTTHVSHAWRGLDIWSRPAMEVVQSNAYTKYPELGQVDTVATLTKIYHDLHKRFGRPVIIAEYGGHWMTNTPEALDAELHSGIWAMAMMPYAGSTGFWWWLHVHFGDRYAHYRALANYMKGEDRRGRNLVQANLLVTSPDDVLKAVGLQNKTSANVWVYHQQVPTSLEGIPPVRGATLGLAGLTDGVYRVEYWDTYQGVKTEETRARAVEGRMTIKLPVVKNDLALKVALETPDRKSPDVP